MEQKADLMIVLPIYNPHCADWERMIDSSLKKLFDIFKNIDLKILFVNDGSSNNLDEGLNNLKINFPDIDIVSYKKNRGKGYAIRTGLRIAMAKHYIYTDWDFPFGEVSVYETYKMLNNNNTDMVLGVRSNEYFASLPRARKLISRGLRFFNFFWFGFKNVDTQAGIKGLSNNARLIFLETKTDGFIFELEFIKAIIKNKMQISFINVSPRNDISFNNFKTKTIVKEFGYFLKLFFS